MLLIVGTVRLPPDRLPLAKPAMSQMIEATRAEAGCVEYSYAEDLLDPGLIHVMELWESRSNLEAHFQSDHIAQWRAVWPELGISERNLQLYEVGAPQPT